MCGINLIIDRRSKLSTDDCIRRMSEATLHRGPDAQGWLRTGGAGHQLFIGNNRLKILDLSDRGNQPMQCAENGKEGSRYTLSYNGELYNYFELKNELLQKGYIFRSTTDTEVLLYALAEWGQKILSRLHGMFALAFYDQEKDLLLLARDRHGMKPLYYHQQDDFLVVSSEIRGIMATQLLPKKLNESQLFHYLQFRYAQKPQTFFQEVFELLPGQLLKARGSKAGITISSFPAPEAPVFTETDPSKITAIAEEKLTDALISHLHTDRDTGIFLSGGMDSALMLALLRHHSSNRLPDCFTITNSPDEAAWGTQDYLWAERAARQYQFRHHPLAIDAGILNHFSSFTGGLDQPIGDGAVLLTAHLADFAGKKVKVVLSGAGADELFGGYNRHQAFYTYLKHYQKIRRILPLLKPVGNILPPGRLNNLRKPLRLWKKVLRELDPSPSKTFLNFLSFQVPESHENHHLQQEGGGFTEGWMRAALSHDRKNYLVSDILALNDKAGMQHSLEMRMPYLAEEVSSFAEAIPASLRLKYGRKWILAEILNKHGGKAFTERKKEGFGLPFGLWIKEGKTDFLWEWLQDAHHPLLQYLDADTVRSYLALHKSGKEDFTQELFSLAVLAHWLTKEFS